MLQPEANIFVVDRARIPAIRSVVQDGKLHELGELRDFRWHAELERLMPPAETLAISYVALKPNEVLRPHTHPIQSMMIFYRGAGTMLGQRPQPVRQGDVVVVPPGCEHGFVGGPDGLWGLSIQFGHGLYTAPDRPRVVFSDEEYDLAQLCAHNRERLGRFEQKPFFRILGDGTLEDSNRRRTFLDALQVWVNGNQTLLFTRQGTCRDPSYAPIFLKHLHEEMGHDRLHADRQDGGHPGAAPETSTVRDPALEAITSWFPYQMLVLDNVEKAAIIHLVIENASISYHRIAKPHLARYVNTEYFDVHLAVDAEHAALGEELLRNQHPRTYRRLKVIIDDAWDMLEAMTDRVTDLTLAVDG